jgi:hypothetical protein
VTGLIRNGIGLRRLILKAASNNGVMSMLVCCEEILKEKKRSLSHRTSVLGLLHPRGLVHLLLYLWTSERMIQMTRLQFKRKFLPLKLSLVFQISSLDVNFFMNVNMFSFHRRDCLGPPSPF